MIVLTRDDIYEMAKVKEKLAANFEIKDLGSLRYFLSMKVFPSKKVVIISKQNIYILNILKETRMSGYKPPDTTMNLIQNVGGKGS